jgi:4-diphosphocytidyl-2-C-methyl-D-erythritol kinase
VRLRAPAPAKVNLCLFLGELRADGRHDLVTLFESLSLADEVEVTTGVSDADEVLCPGIEGPNIVSTALSLLRARGWDAPPTRITIEKRIPIAAGLGGGSADAAAVLRIAPFVSPVPVGVPAEIATELGADVPSQLEPGLVLGTGAGDEVRPVTARLPHAFVVVPQAEGLSTADVYARADGLGLPRDPSDLDARRSELLSAIESGPGLPPELLVNDLEPASVSLHPAIARALEAVRGAGADHALICGSGPTVAGVFCGSDAFNRAGAAANGLVGRFPRACAAQPVAPGFGSPVAE